VTATASVETPSSQPWPRTTSAWYAVAILLIAYTFAYIDRAILTILVEPIQADLNINDTQVGLLHGFAFVIFYVGLGVPIGYLADRMNRKWLIVVSIGVWSLMTAACGLAKSFPQLFLARVGVGVGEAGLSPASYSLISDYFPPERRSAALGVYTIGIYLGAGLAILTGGVLVGLIGDRPSVVVPILGEVRSWQLVFILVGLPGLLVALLAMTFKEPARRLEKTETATKSFKQAWPAIAAHMASQKAAYALHFVGFAFLGVPFNVALLWARPYLSRHFEMEPAPAAYVVGGLMLAFATTGILTGSILSDRLQAAGRKEATIRVGILAGCGMILPILAFPFMPTVALTAAALGVLLFFGAFAYGAAASSLQLITPNRMRALVSAFYLLVVNLVGLMSGPVITGALTDYVFRDPLAVGYSVSCVSGGAIVIALLALLALRKPFREAVAVREAALA
jgi:MFS family permease